MDKYTSIIAEKIRFIHNGVYIDLNTYYKEKQYQVRKSIDLLDSKEYSNIIKSILIKLKRKPSSVYFFTIMIGIFIVFMYDYQNDLFLNALGWINILGSIFGFYVNNKINKVNLLIDNIMYDPAEYVNFEKEFKKASNSTSESRLLKDKLFELKSLRDDNILTEEEYELKRKKIIEED